MGKGKRNREKRRGKVEQKGLNELLDELFDLQSADDLVALLERRPELRTEGFERQLAELSHAPGYGPPFQLFLELLRVSRSDVSAAWATYLSAKRRADALGEKLQLKESELRRAAEAGDYTSVIAIADAAIPEAEDAGLGVLLSILHEQRGMAFFRRASADRAPDIEEAIVSMERAAFFAVPGEHRATVFIHLGIAQSERIRGDRADNTERAIEVLGTSLVELEDVDSPELKALAETNLAMALIRRTGGDRANNLRAAANACRSALSFRSLDHNPIDWAYSQLNLSEALDNLAALGDLEAEAAREAYEAVVTALARIPEPWLVGLAHQGLARGEMRAADVDLDELAEVPEGELEPVAKKESLNRARYHLEQACALLRTGPEPLRLGRALADLADVLASQGNDEDAIDAARQALSILRPTGEPRACLDVAGRLGDLLAQRGDWNGAVDAFRDALAAADLAFHTQVETTSRQREQRRAGNVYRWAAYAIARAGKATEAALVLESGRAREIRRRLGVEVADSELADVPYELCERYRSAAAELGTSPFGFAGAAAARALQEVVAEIRELPGHEDFLIGVDPNDLESATEHGFPLIYVNPTPYGTVFITVNQDADSAVTATFHDSPTSTDVVLHLMAGAAAEAEDPSQIETPTSYLFGISGANPARDFKPDLDEILAWLGRAVANAIDDLLVEAGAAGCTLVVCGPLGLAPLHAGFWSDGTTARSLLDQFEVRYAPSAALMATALRRSASRQVEQPKLVALANPTEDLAATEPEVLEIAQFFEKGCTACAFRNAADRSFLEQHASGATFLHFACHGRAGLFETNDASLELADGPVSAEELAALGPLHARMIAVSACQSGLWHLADLSEEAISIGAAMLASGGACAIATLWPVDDLATAILMTRLYEEIRVADRRPPDALRHTQLWLRTLTESDEAEFLERHPALMAEYRRRLERDDLPGRRGGTADGESGDHPVYTHPEYWAAFTAVGA